MANVHKSDRQRDTNTDVLPPPPPSAMKLYDPDRNRKWGVLTEEDVQTELQGNQQVLSARIRQNKAERQTRTWRDAVQRASEGIYIKALKRSLTGTKRATEMMIKLTGYSAPTIQTRIQYAEFFPWAAPALREMWERSQHETEPGKGVRDFEMPSDRAIIEMGQEAAREAGCWGLARVIMVTPSSATIEAIDVPKNSDRKASKSGSPPQWKTRGRLDDPWGAFQLYVEAGGGETQATERSGSGQSWTLDLMRQGGRPMVITERGFIARVENDTIVNASDVLGLLRPYISFIEEQKKTDVVAGYVELEGDSIISKPDATGKTHATLADIAAGLDTPSATLVSLLCHYGYLDAAGEYTAAALDDGIAVIINGGTQFDPGAVRRFVEEHAAAMPDDTTPGETKEQDHATATEPDGSAGTKPRGQIAGGRGPAPHVKGEPERTATVMTPTEAASGVSEVHVSADDIVAQIEDSKMILRSLKGATGWRTEIGDFTPHGGDQQVLLAHIRAGAEAMAKADALLTNTQEACQALARVIAHLQAEKARLEEENMHLKHDAAEQQAKVDELERTLAGLHARLHDRNPVMGADDSETYAEVITFRVTPRSDEGSGATASH